MRDLLVTGTDTGVGKTVIAAALVKALRGRGVRAIGFKPLESGVDGSGAADSDVLAEVSEERPPFAAPILRLADPLAPAVAAERAGLGVSGRDVEARIDRLRQDGYHVVVEGAGGVLVPLSWQSGAHGRFPFYTVLDLARACGLDAVVVARAGLGTLNHVALTVELLRASQVPVRGVVLNRRAAPPDLAESTNPAALGRMLGTVRIVEVPEHAGGNPIDAAVPLIDRLL